MALTTLRGASTRPFSVADGMSYGRRRLSGATPYQDPNQIYSKEDGGGTVQPDPTAAPPITAAPPPATTPPAATTPVTTPPAATPPATNPAIARPNAYGGLTGGGYGGVPNPATAKVDNAGFANFRFPNPSNAFQANFNYIAQHNGINSAMSWAFDQPSETRTQLYEAMHPENANDWNNLVNQYSPGGGAPLGGIGNYEGSWWQYGGMDAYRKAAAAAKKAGGHLSRRDWQSDPKNKITLPGYTAPGSAPPPGTPPPHGDPDPNDPNKTVTDPLSPDYTTPLTSDQIKAFMDPSYDWRLHQGLDAVEQSAAARGGLNSGEALKNVNDYAQGAASQEFGNAYTRAATDRNFRLGVDQNDRDFNYRTSTGDRDFNYQTLKDAANLGLQGTQGSNALAIALAQLLSGNTMAAGGAGAAGLVGGGNIISQLLSQWIAQMNGNNIVNNTTPPKTP